MGKRSLFRRLPLQAMERVTAPKQLGLPSRRYVSFQEAPLPISMTDIGRKAVIRVAPRASRLRVTADKLAEEESGGHRWPPVSGLGALTCGSTVACHRPTPNCQNVLDQPLKRAVWQSGAGGKLWTPYPGHRIEL